MSGISDENGPAVPTGDRIAEPRIQKWLADASWLLGRLEQGETHYAALSIDPGAGSAEVNAAYRETVIALTRAFSDLRDLVPGDQLQEFKRALARVREAYNVLGDRDNRADYDNQLKKNAPAEREAPAGFGNGDEVTSAGEIDAELAVRLASSIPAPAEPSLSRGATLEAADRIGGFREPALDGDNSNRRRFGRTDLNLLARLTRTDDQGQKWQELVKTLEVSKTGASFGTKYGPKVGSVVHLALPMPLGLRLHGHSEPAYSTYALVRRVRPFDQDHKVVGVEFLGARPPRQYTLYPSAIFNVDNWRGPDRRRCRRENREEMVAVRFLNDSSDVIGVSLGLTENVGLRGARIRLEKPVPDFHRIRIMCANVGFESLATICRSYRGPDTRQRLCINFTEGEWTGSHP